MIFKHFLLAANESNLYVVGCEETRQAAIIDAGAFDPRVLDFIREHQLSVKAILLTHGHWDHTDGLAEYVKQLNCPAKRYNDFQDGDVIQIGSLNIKALKTTGHTEDSLSFYVQQESLIFTGDALFAGSIGGTHSEEKKNELLRNIQEKILALPPNTIIYPGHGPASSVNIESRHNPFLVQS